MHLVKSILEVKPYKLILKFSNGEVRSVDLENRILKRSQSPDSKYRALIDKDYFSSVKLHPEWETVYWENGIDFCPDVLYMEGEPVN